jgi:hypothetical protein
MNGPTLGLLTTFGEAAVCARGLKRLDCSDLLGLVSLRVQSTICVCHKQTTRPAAFYGDNPYTIGANNRDRGGSAAP